MGDVCVPCRYYYTYVAELSDQEIAVWIGAVPVLVPPPPILNTHIHVCIAATPGPCLLKNRQSTGIVHVVLGRL